MISLEINTTFKDINFVSIFKKEKEESNTIKLVSSVRVSIVVALFVSNRIFHHNYSCVHIIHSDNYIVILVIQIIRNDRNNWTFVFFCYRLPIFVICQIIALLISLYLQTSDQPRSHRALQFHSVTPSGSMDSITLSFLSRQNY